MGVARTSFRANFLVVSTKPMAQQMGQPRKASSDTPARANEYTGCCSEIDIA